jgi:hypothetical protein
MSLGFYDGNLARGGKLFDVREITFWFEVLGKCSIPGKA